ncbi:MAG TPA: hypothetical protein VJN70_02030 [Gemmatimonadaceae bacterium]|nr:hypothetical protein [Gemmatimonadaceae bacterium]
MSRRTSRGPRERTLEEEAEAEDLQLAIGATLAATPIDDYALRRGVLTYVSSERGIGTLPGDLIACLTTIVETSSAPTQAREAVMRRVTLWCLEGYFGRLGKRHSEDNNADRVIERVDHGRLRIRVEG